MLMMMMMMTVMMMMINHDVVKLVATRRPNVDHLHGLITMQEPTTSPVLAEPSGEVETWLPTEPRARILCGHAHVAHRAAPAVDGRRGRPVGARKAGLDVAANGVVCGARREQQVLACEEQVLAGFGVEWR